MVGIELGAVAVTLRAQEGQPITVLDIMTKVAEVIASSSRRRALRVSEREDVRAADETPLIEMFLESESKANTPWDTTVRRGVVELMFFPPQQRQPENKNRNTNQLRPYRHISARSI